MMPTDQVPANGPGGHPRLSQPSEWDNHGPSAKILAATGFLALLTLAGGAGTAWALATGQRAAGLLLALGTTYVGHLVGLGVSTWWTPSRARHSAKLTTASDGHDGVTFTYSRWPYYWLTAVLFMTTAALAAVAVGAATTATVPGLAISIVTAALALALLWLLITLLRLAPGSIILTPAGVHHRSLTFTHFVPWYAVFDVSTEWTSTSLIVVKAFPSDDTRVTRCTGHMGTHEMQLLPYLAVRTSWLAADPASVFHTLAYYHAHPEHHAELATPAAIDRINRRLP
jgi:hypothetical protein